MPVINCALAAVPYRGKHLERLQEIFGKTRLVRVDPGNSEALDHALLEADVAVVPDDGDDRYLSAPELRWLHCDQAGLDHLARREALDRDLIITSSAGRSGPALAEHALFFMLSLTYCAQRFAWAQRRREWGFPGCDDLGGLFGRTVLILGLGHTGKALAVRAKALGMNVLGYRRSPAETPGVDRLYSRDSGDALDEPLGQADFIVIALPLTDKTYKLLGAREFGLMKQGAYLVNVGRGAVLDERVLGDALDNGGLAGAGLDVFTREPLPGNSPLWRHPKVLITPHVTPQMPDRTSRSLEILAQNVRRYESGEPMLNRLTLDDIYTRGSDGWREPPYRRWLRRVLPACVRASARRWLPRSW